MKCSQGPSWNTAGGKQVYRNKSQDCDYVGSREVWRYNIQVSTSHLALQWSSRVHLLKKKGEKKDVFSSGFERYL